MSSFWLSRFVAEVRVVAPITGRAVDLHRLPDGRTTIFVRLLEEGGEPDVWVAGPRTRAQFRRKNGVARMVTVQLKPGWSVPLLGVPASALTDQLVPLTEIWGRARGDLSGQLLTARSVPELLGRLSRALESRSQHTFEPAASRLARRAVRLLEGEEVRVERVAKRLGVSARHLRRAFTESVGIGVKDYARTVRLQRALRLSATSQDWVGIAVAAGYYDQAHLIADFRQLIGLTPSAFLKRASQAPEDSKPGTVCR
jgi:AraC-like DNA-binding protein